MPSIEIEISLPDTTEVTTVFGETDHYLEATKDTVRWGYFDAEAPFMASMESGEIFSTGLQARALKRSPFLSLPGLVFI
jgi:hypothetical protein